MPTIKVTSNLDEVEAQCNRIIVKLETIQRLHCDVQAMVLGENQGPVVVERACNFEDAIRMAKKNAL